MRRFTLDTGCVIALVRPDPLDPPGEVAALEQMLEVALAGRVELQLATAYDRDAGRYESEEGRARQRAWLEKAPILDLRASGGFVLGVSTLGGGDVLASDEDAALYRAVRRVLIPHLEERLNAGTVDDVAKKTSDSDHIVASVRSGADAFVTLDHATILNRREALLELGARVCLPTEALAMVRRQ